LNQSDGILLQELPFAIELKKFVVEFYSTGMPKLFASDIIIHDKETGEKVPARVEVNHPAKYKGVEIFQSSFDDGGSTIRLKAIPMSAATKPFELEGVIGGSSQLTRGAGNTGDKLTVEYTGLRVINVENFSGSGMNDGQGVDVRKVDLRESIQSRMGAANKTATKKELRNVGPSVTYKLRDEAGQAREYHNYMLPVDTGDGAPVFLLGLRDTPAERFRYLRVPADEQGSMDEFLRLKAALADPETRKQAIDRYSAKAIDQTKPELARQLAASATRALGLFAGDEAGKDGKPVAGLQAVADFIESNVPEAERAKAGEVLIRILNGTLFELVQTARERASLQPLEPNEKSQAFMTQAVLALSDANAYPAPLALQLSDFTQVQASVFQVARAPGKNVVYLGCLLLILGVFAMLYVRERRLWIWLAPKADGSLATMALSTNRKTMDGDREFEQLKLKLIGVKD
jgi:cytochrome c biogenesis protein